MAKSSFYSGSQQVSANSNAVEDSKNAAALSEAAAAASAAASATSAASGAASATTATTKASESAASATASATSAAASEVSNAASGVAKVASEAAQSASENARDAAAASSTSASSSQAAASTSETNASTSAAAALASENAAAASAATAATEATDSATSAAASEVSNVASGVAKVAAETAETNAETAQAASEAARDAAAASETAAATSEANASSSEGVATTQAGIATTKATESAASASASLSSQNAAASSASSASSSASAAATSASEAATNAASVNLNSIDIDGGTIDGTVIGGSVPAAGSFTTGSFTGNVTHGDNVKATFGASADLEVYHNGSNSYIMDNGAGDLNLHGTNLGLRNSAGEYYFYGASDGAVTLYHNNVYKMVTTTSGIDVNGTVVADGLTVDGDALEAVFAGLTSSTVHIKGDTSNSGDANEEDAVLKLSTDNGQFHHRLSALNGAGRAPLQFTHFNGSSDNKTLTVDYNSDISFYDGSGSAKFFWDASAERLGIGTTTPSTPLHVSTSADNVATFASTDTGARIVIADSTDTGYVNVSSGKVSLGQTEGLSSNNLNIDSSGRVGIGTSSPNSAADLHIHSTSGTALWLTSNGNNPSDAGFIRMSEQLDGSGAYFELQHDGSNNVLNLYSSNQNATVQSWDRVGGNTNFHNSSGTAKLTWHAVDEELQLASGVALELNGWTVTESGGSLYFATGGSNKMKLDASGNLDVVGSVNSNATIS